MSGKRGIQKTLFQTWEKKNPDIRLPSGNSKPGGSSSSKIVKRENRTVFSGEDDDGMLDLTDDDLLVAAEALESTLKDEDVAGPSGAQGKFIFIVYVPLSS